MLLLGGVGLVVELVLLVYCLLNVITTPESQVRNLPKAAWLVLVVILPLVGGISWLVAGRPVGSARTAPYRGNAGVLPEYDRPGRAVARNPDDDEAFLRRLHERAEEQRRRASEQARRIRDEEEPPPV